MLLSNLIKITSLTCSLSGRSAEIP